VSRIKIDWTKRTTAAERDAEDAVLRARRYLAETDWMVVRAAEGAKPVPKDILAARAAARKTISGE
jgi:hypothetical protein